MGLNDIKIIEGNKGCGMTLFALKMAYEIRLMFRNRNLIMDCRENGGIKTDLRHLRKMSF